MLEGLVPAPEALSIVLDGAEPARTVSVPLREAAGRVLATDLAARRTQPPFPASAMDGYAVRAADLQDLPAQLTCIGQSAAGHPFAGDVGTGQAVRIFTGAPVPEGADAIVIQENTRHDGDTVIIEAGSPAGKFIRPAGLDFVACQQCLSRGDVLNAQRLALAASMDHGELTVYAKPVVALAMTGDELYWPGSDLPPGGIIASNAYAIAAMIEKAGGEIMNLGIVEDSQKALEAAMRRAIEAGADLLVTTGGASVGDHDLIRPAFEAIGGNLAFAKIAMRPGKPFLFGDIRGGSRTVRFAGLAGNPVSSIVATRVFVVPLVASLAGLPPARTRPVPAILGSDLPANDERQDYLRAKLRRLPDGGHEATPFGRQDSSMLAMLANSDALVIRPVHAPAAKVGDPVEILPTTDF